MYDISFAVALQEDKLLANDTVLRQNIRRGNTILAKAKSSSNFRGKRGKKQP